MKNVVIVSILILILISCQVYSMDDAREFSMRRLSIEVSDEKTKTDASTLSRAAEKPVQGAEINFEIDMNEKQRDPKWFAINRGSVQQRMLLPYAVNWEARRTSPTLHVFAKQESGFDADRDGQTWDLEYEIDKSGLHLKSRAIVEFGLSSTLGLVKNYKKQAIFQGADKQYHATLMARPVFEPLIKVSIKALTDKADKKS